MPKITKKRSRSPSSKPKSPKKTKKTKKTDGGVVTKTENKPDGISDSLFNTKSGCIIS
jgi:hypothetical protein